MESIPETKHPVKRKRPPNPVEMEKTASQPKQDGLPHDTADKNRSDVYKVYTRTTLSHNPPTDRYDQITAALTAAGYHVMHMMTLPTGKHRANRWWGFPLIIASKQQRKRYNTPAGKRAR